MRVVVISCLALALAAGCSRSDDKKVATQVAAPGR